MFREHAPDHPVALTTALVSCEFRLILARTSTDACIRMREWSRPTGCSKAHERSDHARFILGSTARNAWAAGHSAAAAARPYGTAPLRGAAKIDPDTSAWWAAGDRRPATTPQPLELTRPRSRWNRAYTWATRRLHPWETRLFILVWRWRSASLGGRHYQRVETRDDAAAQTPHQRPRETSRLAAKPAAGTNEKLASASVPLGTDARSRRMKSPCRAVTLFTLSSQSALLLRSAQSENVRPGALVRVRGAFGAEDVETRMATFRRPHPAGVKKRSKSNQAHQFAFAAINLPRGRAWAKDRALF